jgi:glycerol-3-phosphate acyltransferase PlsY
MEKIKFISISIATFLVMITIWFLVCFMLGYASSSNYQKEIWIFYLATLFLHFFIMLMILNRLFGSKLNFFYLLFNLIMYSGTAWYFYNYS